MTDSDGLLIDVDMTGVEHLGFDDVRGPITFRYLPEELQRQLDQTQHADWEAHHWRPSVYRDRAATEAEKYLLEFLGITLPTNLTARVRYISGGVRRVDFPQLADQLEALR